MRTDFAKFSDFSAQLSEVLDGANDARSFHDSGKAMICAKIKHKKSAPKRYLKADFVIAHKKCVFLHHFCDRRKVKTIMASLRFL